MLTLNCSVHRCNTRNRMTYYLSAITKQYEIHSLRHEAPSVWNSLPSYITYVNSLNSFKESLIYILFPMILNCNNTHITPQCNFVQGCAVYIFVLFMFYFVLFCFCIFLIVYSYIILYDSFTNFTVYVNLSHFMVAVQTNPLVLLYSN